MKPGSGKRFCKVLERHGWSLVRINGSHHMYNRPGHPDLLSVPVHGNRMLKKGTTAIGCSRRAHKAAS